MHISKEGIALIKKFEGCELEAYLCPAGVLTIAYGRTKGVKENDTCTYSEAEEWLEEELTEYEDYVKNLIKVDLTQNQFDSLVCWTYNLGPTNLKKSTLLKVLNEGDYDSVPSQMKRWNKSQGEVLEGLIRRREAEALLFEEKQWENV
tara:strand:+ start:911 stop:1354 length:444 start_codon:yes stop_codon:yes gene_type:complete